MNVDTELETWRRQWQSGITVPLDLRKKVERQSRFMKIALMGDILVTITIGGARTDWAIRSPQPEMGIAGGCYVGIYRNCLDVFAHCQSRQLVSVRAGHCRLCRPFGAALPRQAGGGLVRSRTFPVTNGILPGLGP